MLHNSVGRPPNLALRSRIVALAASGFTRKAIAAELGCNYTTVKRLLEDLHGDGLIQYYVPHRLTLQQSIRDRYVEEAKRLGMNPTTLMCHILTIVANDNMFKAVLDCDDEET